jgi:hypothetical protein
VSTFIHTVTLMTFFLGLNALTREESALDLVLMASEFVAHVRIIMNNL